MAKPIPEGYHTLTPRLVMKDATRAIEFYKKAFGAEELARFPGPGGKGVMHATLRIGSSRLHLTDELPAARTSEAPVTLEGNHTGAIQINVENADATFKRAVEAGGKVAQPLADMFWGDRYGEVIDPDGHVWGISTHKEDLSNPEMMKRAERFFASLPK